MPTLQNIFNRYNSSGHKLPEPLTLKLVPFSAQFKWRLYTFLDFLFMFRK